MKYNNLSDSITNRRLKKIAVKVFEEIPVSKADAGYMLSTDDILDLGKISNFIRTKLHGDAAYYGVNMNLNFTNICELRCPLCAFSRDEGDKDAFVLSLDEITERVQKAVLFGIDEVHIVGGLHPELKIDYFEKMIRRIKKIKPSLFVVAFTAVEIDYFAKKTKSP